MRVEIYIDNTKVDLPPSFRGAALTYAIKSREGVTTNTGSRSEYSVELPATKKNNNLFNQFINPATLNIDKQKLLDCYMLVDGIQYFTGKAQIVSLKQSARPYGRKAESYNVAFYGNNIDWVSEVREKRIYQYDWSTHTFNDTTIAASLPFSTGDEYTYHPIKLKDWASSTHIAYLEMTPMLHVSTLTDFIFDDINYNVSSTFFSTTFYKSLFMPVVLGSKLSTDFSDDYLVVETEDTDIPIATGALTQTRQPAVGANPLGVASGESRYTAPYKGFYRFRVELDVTKTSGVDVDVFIELKQGSNVKLDVRRTSVTTSDSTSGEIVLALDAGDQIDFDLTVNISNGNGIMSIRAFVDGEVTIEDGNPMNFKYVVPKDWKVLDFLAGITHAFNLVWDADPLTRTITVEPADRYKDVILRDGFYTGSEEYTSKIDLTRQAELKSEINEGESIQLTWKYDGETEEAINKLNDLGLLAGRYNFDSGRYTKNEQVIENPFFAACLNIAEEAYRSSTSRQTPQLPFIWNGNYKENTTSTEVVTNPAPRLLLKVNTSANNRLAVIDSNSITYDIGCPQAFMINYNDTIAADLSLSFGNATIHGNEVKGLMDRFYLRSLKRREIGKNLQEYLFFSRTDIANLNFRTKKIIEGNEYILQEVNSFNVLQKKSTKVYLQYDAPLEVGDEDKIESSTVTNQV